MTKIKNKFCPSSFKECFYFDDSNLNPTPRGIFRKIINLFLSPRYSMTTLMRLTQYMFQKSKSGNRFRRFISVYVVAFLKRLNSILHNFEHGSNPKIASGVIFHHTGVCITGHTIIESGVHIYRNVTFGGKNEGTPHVKNGAKIGSHSIILGPVEIGKRAIVAPGAVVVKDVPDGKVAAGVPAKIIGNVTDENYDF